MAEDLSKIGLFVDDIYSLKVIEPTVSNETADLKDESASYIQKLDEFRDLIAELVTLAELFSEKVDRQKVRAIGVENLLKTTSKQRESEKQELQVKIQDKNVELDRLKIETQYLQRIESEQQEIIDSFYQNQ